MELFFSAKKSSEKFCCACLKTKHPAWLVSAGRDASDLGCALD
jgi:hypothetical protein